MTSPHPLAAWVERAQVPQPRVPQPRRSPAERFPAVDEDDLDDRRRRGIRALSRRRTRTTTAVSRVRYS